MSKNKEIQKIPKWHKTILEERLIKYGNNGDKSSFKTWEDIEKEIKPYDDIQ